MLSIYCLICNKEFNNLGNLSKHIVVHNITTQQYYEKFLKKETEGFCIICQNPTKYHNITKGYRNHCSKKCASITSSYKQWNDGEKSENRKNKTREQFKQYANMNGRPKGTKNINPYPETEKVLQRYKNYPPPSWSGKHHTEKTKKLKSQLMYEYIEKNGFKMSYKGIYKIKHPEKYIGDHTNIIWRSTWEHKFMNYLDTTASVLKWSSEEFSIPYFDPTTNRYRRYFPDFYMKVQQKCGAIQEYVVEIKPSRETKPPKQNIKTKKFNERAAKYIVNTSKWQAANQFCESKGWKFQIITEKELYATNADK